MSREVDWHPSVQDSPCDGCRHATRCREQRLACSRFSLFQNRNVIDPRKPQVPRRWVYVRLFGE